MITKEDLEKEVKKGLSYRKIAINLNVCASTVRTYLDKYGIKTNPKENKRVPIYIDKLPIIVKNSYTMSDVIRAVGLKVRAGNYSTISKWCIKLGLSTEHFLGKGHGKTIDINRKKDEELFVANCNIARHSVKRRIINKKIIPYKCSICYLDPIWQNKKLVLILDHINGINNDNRIENLRFLCPNCNSQQKTFCRGNATVAQ